MKYLIGVGALIVIVVGSLLLFPAPRQVPEPTAVVTAPGAPATGPATASAPEEGTTPKVVAQPAEGSLTGAQDEWLLSLAASTRESLPASVSESLTITDALFLPRMRIMEYTYVSSALDAPASAREMRTLIDSGAERLCLEGQEMFEMGVTLRNSFRDREGVLFQRVYLLPEDCQQFY